MRYALFLWLALTAPAQALEYCDELWFTRNMVFERLGYCFGSPLGQAVFDNSDCTTTAPNLTDAAKALVNRMKAEEAEWSCRTDTTRGSLNIPDLSQRLRLANIPIPTPYESACLGWLAGPVPLRAGHDNRHPQIGQIETGETIGYAFENVGDWHYVIVGEYGTAQRFGWAFLPETQGQCADYAG